MTKPVHITAKDAARAALKAHEEGRLGYQLPKDHPQAGECLYHYRPAVGGKRHVCAIGASLPEGFWEYGTVYELQGSGYITAPDADRRAIADLQVLHDLCLAEFDNPQPAVDEFLDFARRLAGERE